MSTILNQENNLIKIKQYIIDSKGQKIAAILDIEELKRLEKLIEDLADLRTIEERKNETEEDYEAYSNKRKSQLIIEKFLTLL